MLPRFHFCVALMSGCGWGCSFGLHLLQKRLCKYGPIELLSGPYPRLFHVFYICKSTCVYIYIYIITHCKIYAYPFMTTHLYIKPRHFFGPPESVLVSLDEPAPIPSSSSSTSGGGMSGGGNGGPCFPPAGPSATKVSTRRRGISSDPAMAMATNTWIRQDSPHVHACTGANTIKQWSFCEIHAFHVHEFDEEMWTELDSQWVQQAWFRLASNHALWSSLSRISSDQLHTCILHQT